MSVINIKINGVPQPLGYDFSDLLLSWHVTDSNSSTTVNSCVVVRQDTRDGKVVFQTSGNLAWEGTKLNIPSLLPRTRYWISVEVEDDFGALHTGESWFETGKLKEPWHAKWICPENAAEFAPVLTRSFSSSKAVSSARLYMVGLGLYSAVLNGLPVSNEVLAPGFWYYEKEAPYQTYDITNLIHEHNTIEVTLGNGWYKGRFGLEHTPYSDQYSMLAELHISYSDGTEQVVCSDEQWMWKESDIGANGIYDGEILDRLSHSGQDMTLFPVSVVAPPLSTVERLNPPVVEMLTLPVIEVLHTPAGETVLDFGQNHTGLLRFHAHLPAGARVHFDFGEVLQQGNFYNENYRSALGGFTYYSDGRIETVCQQFTFYGFRYVRVTGWPGEINPSDFDSPVLHTAMDRTGWLTTGHKNLNRLYENTLWGQRSNFLSIPTDCPQRDERLAWTGDAQVFTPTACYNMDCRAFYRSFLHLLALDQADHDGSIATCLPRSPGFISCAIWSDASALIPETMHRFSSSVDEIAPYYPMMKAWVDYVACRANNYLYDEEQLGDWLALDGATPQSFKGSTDDTYLGSVYFMNSTRITAKFARLLGYEHEADHYQELADNIRDSIMNHYFTPAGRLSVDTQAAFITAFKFGLWIDKEVLVKQFMRRMKLDGFQIRCGFAGAPLMCSVLAEHGMETLACDLLLNRDFPGWMYCVESGATTVWERWNSLLPDGTCSGTGMNSFNHYAYGSVMEFVYAYLAGLRPGEQGFRVASISPQPDIRIGYVNCSFDSPSGKYVSNWEICEDGMIKIHIEVPFGCSALVTLPRSGKDPFCVHAGHYDYVYMPTQDYRAVYSMNTHLSALDRDEEALKILAEEAPVLIGMLQMKNHEFTAQTFRELCSAFFLGLNEEKVTHIVEKLSKLIHTPNQEVR